MNNLENGDVERKRRATENYCSNQKSEFCKDCTMCNYSRDCHNNELDDVYGSITTRHYDVSLDEFEKAFFGEE